MYLFLLYCVHLLPPLMSHFLCCLCYLSCPCLPLGAGANTKQSEQQEQNGPDVSHSLSHHGLFGVHLLGGGRGHFLDDWGDVGGPVQLDLGEAVLVGFHHALDPCNTHTYGFFCCFVICLPACVSVCSTTLTSPGQSPRTWKSIC